MFRSVLFVFPCFFISGCDIVGGSDGHGTDNGSSADDTSSTDPPEGTVQVVLTTTLRGAPESCQLEVCVDNGATCHAQETGTAFTLADMATVQIGTTANGTDSNGHPLHQDADGNTWTAPTLSFQLVDGQVKVSDALGVIDSLTPVDGKVEYGQAFNWYYNGIYRWSRFDYRYDAEAEDYRGEEGAGDVNIENDRLQIETVDGYLLDTGGFNIGDISRPEQYLVVGTKFVADDDLVFVNNYTYENGTISYDLVKPDVNSVAHLEGEMQ